MAGGVWRLETMENSGAVSELPYCYALCPITPRGGPPCKMSHPRNNLSTTNLCFFTSFKLNHPIDEHNTWHPVFKWCLWFLNVRLYYWLYYWFKRVLLLKTALFRFRLANLDKAFHVLSPNLRIPGESVITSYHSDDNGLTQGCYVQWSWVLDFLYVNM